MGRMSASGLQRKVLLLAVAALLAPAATRAEEEPRPVVPLFGEADEGAAGTAWGLGPIDSGDPYPLALARFMIPIDSPETARAGRVRLRGPNVTWASTQVVREDAVVDAEVLLASVRVDLGLADRWEVSLSLPFHYASAGILDGMVDEFHEVIGALDANREERGRNLFLLRVGDTTIRRGFRVGDLSAGTEFRILDGGNFVPALSASAWLKAPTASSPSLGRQGWDFAVTAQASERLGPLVLYAGGGWAVTTDNQLGDIGYRRASWTVWGGGELGIAPGLVAEVHTWVRAALIRGTKDTAHRQCYVVAGLRYRFSLGGGIQADVMAGFLENYRHIESAADFGWVFGVEVRF